jgi:YVTN family beta-propeller protein
MIGILGEGSVSYRQFFRTSLAVFCLASLASAGILQTFKVGRQPTHIGVNFPTNRVYVDNVLDNTVSVIDLSVNKVTATVPLASKPAGLAVNPATNRFYVSVKGGVAVYDGVDNSLITTIVVSGNPSIIAMNPNNKNIYVQDSADNEVHVIDTDSDEVIAELPVSHPGNGIAFDPTTNQVFVSSASPSGGSVSVFDGSSNLLINTLTLPGNPSFTYLDTLKGFGFLYLYAITQPAGGGPYSFSVVDTSSGALVNQIPLQGTPGGVIAEGISNEEAITNDGMSKVDFMHQNETKIHCKEQVGRGPAGMAIIAPWFNAEMVVANRLDNTVTLVGGFGCP